MTMIDRRYGVAEGTAVKAPVRAATTANITLSGEQTIDGIAVVADDRVLVKNQDTASENGIYVASTGNWTRAKDWDGAYDVVTGSRVLVNLGTANARTEWFVSTTGDITIGTTGVAFTLLGGVGSPFADGTVAAPGASFTNYPSWGWYKTTSGIGISINGTLVSEFLSTGMAITGLGITAGTAFTDPAIGDEFPAYDLSATANKKITFANYLKVINGLTEDVSPDRAADYVVTYDASAGAAKKVLFGSVSALPTGYLHGLTLSNGTDATNDIDIAAGKCRDSTDAHDIVLAASITKRLDDSWSVGTGNGGRDTGAISDTTWHVWLIKRTDTGVVDALFSTSPTNPTMPANYDVKRRIGSIIRSSSSIIAFVQNGDEFRKVTAALDISATNPGTSAVSRTLTVPTGIVVEAIFNGGVRNDGTAGSALCYFSPLDATDQAPSANGAPLGSGGALANATAAAAQYSYVAHRIKTNTSAQIRSRVNFSDANVVLYISVLGWVDNRGRLN